MLKREQFFKKRKKGQSTLEYVILFAAVVALLLTFLGPSGIFRGALNQTLKQGTDTMQGMANRLVNAYQ